MSALALITDFVLAAGSEDLANSIRSFVGPILLVVIGIIAIPFLVRREMTQFIMFVVIAIAVFLLFYAPDIIKNLAQGVNEGAGGAGGTWKG
jgi:type IV secretory pathway VirB2 component (pilin)